MWGLPLLWAIHQVSIEYADVRQIPVSLTEIEAVADHDAVRDLEADISDRHVDFPPIRLRHQRTDGEGGRLARLEVPHQVGERQPGVDDVLDDEDVPALDVDVQVLEDPNDARAVGRGAVTGDRHEVDLAWHRQLPHQVGHEEHGALEDADQQRLSAGVVARDLVAELLDARTERVLLDEDLADAPLELSLIHAVHALLRRRRSRARQRLRRRARQAATTRGPSAEPLRPRTRPGSSCSSPRAGRPRATRVP